MTKVCFFFFRVSRKLSPIRCNTLVCCSSHVGSGGGGASGLWKLRGGAGMRNWLTDRCKPHPHPATGEHKRTTLHFFWDFILKHWLQHQQMCTIHKEVGDLGSLEPGTPQVWVTIPSEDRTSSTWLPGSFHHLL